MAAKNAPVAAESSSVSSDELAAKAVHKRFEGLVMVRTKAIKGKGAWYWAHLEPILVHNSDTGLPRAVKLRCSLWRRRFLRLQSVANRPPSISRGAPAPISPPYPSPFPPCRHHPPSRSPARRRTASASPPSSQQPQNHRKRSSSGNRRAGAGAGGVGTPNSGGIATSFPAHHVVPPLAIVDPSRFTVDLAYPPVVSVASTSVVVASASASPSAVGSGGGVGLYAQHPHPHQQQQQQQLVLSGGKEDLGALAMLEDSVKRLKSPKASPGPTLNKDQIDSALDFLADWVYECCGSVSFSSLDHPKFKAFLSQVGLPPISRRELVGSRLDSKYEEAKAESEAKIRDAMFFQVAADWKPKDTTSNNTDHHHHHIGEENFVHLAVNLPNGTNVFRRAVFTSGYVASKYAEDILWDTIVEICGNTLHQCVGIVSDKFKAKALRNLENQHHWMVNICCQYQGFNSLIKDFGKELPLFKNVAEYCLKLANFVNNKSQIRHCFHKYQLQEYGHAGLLRVPLRGYERSDFGPVFAMVEDILSSARALQLVLLDESYKTVLIEEPIAREIEEMMRNPHFWNELEAVHSLVKLIKAMAQEIEIEKPRVGQCLPLWEDLRVKIKDWCCKFSIVEGPVEKIIEKRFRKNYHPSWAAAFILDPIYLIRDASGKYLPPFKCLTPEQEKDVDKLITRLVARDEAHIALMELMKWRTEGLDPVYAQAVQLKQRDPNTGKMRIVNPQSSRLVWETYLTEFKSLGRVAVRLIFLRATSCGFKCNWALTKWASAQSHTRVGMERAQKLIFVSAHSKMEKREFFKDEDGDAELFALENGEDDVLNEVFVDTSSV
ncbi:hypothetical protein PHJA_000325100 [Phtheirospermum japonicum]|uniref:DUF7963 domain-containing protein n=1 Tax=Phtheirospermum japonicum TaxID=374723 RepID=A0A830B9S4_9LAMI|nr:hypothetical protein PHJA_000325100 [Phtheirospermum japonicum]